MLLYDRWPIPSWLAETPDIDRPKANIRFLLSLAEVYCQHRGNAKQLAEVCGIERSTLYGARERGSVTADMALRIEKALGRDLFPWENFLPHLSDSE